MGLRATQRFGAVKRTGGMRKCVGHVRPRISSPDGGKSYTEVSRDLVSSHIFGPTFFLPACLARCEVPKLFFFSNAFVPNGVIFLGTASFMCFLGTASFCFFFFFLHNVRQNPGITR